MLNIFRHAISETDMESGAGALLKAGAMTAVASAVAGMSGHMTGGMTEVNEASAAIVAGGRSTERSGPG